MKDIADHAGVSRATVGFVLSGRDSPVRISDETKRRVLLAADELKYRPNAMARAMRSGRFGSVALLLSTNRSRSLIPMGLLDGIHDALAANDLHLVLTKIPDEKLTNAGFVPRILRESSSDGLIINYNANIPDALISLIRDHRIPAIWVNSKQEADCVYPDDFNALREATEVLYARGHRRIAYIEHKDSSHYSAQDRTNGYCSAMEALGLTPQRIQTVTTGDHRARATSIQEHLAAINRPTALLTYNPHYLTPVMIAAQNLGLKVPRDLSIMTVSDITPSAFGLCFDMMSLPEYELGETAVSLLQEKIADPEHNLKPRVLPLHYVAAETVAEPPG